MTPEQIEQIIDMLAEKLGPMAQVVWEAYVTQAGFVGVRYTILAVVAVLLTLACAAALGAFLYGVKIPEKDKGDRSFWGGCALIDGLLFVMLLAGTIWLTTEAYIRIHNPAYYAIQMLLGR